MQESQTCKLPLPVAQAFVICNEIYQDQRTGRLVLIAPIDHVPVPQFPARVRVSIYAHFTGGHGRYQLELCLHDEDDEIVWRWGPPQPLAHPNPLLLHRVTFNDLLFDVRRAGKYRVALRANGVEFAETTLWLGTFEALRPGAEQSYQ